MGAIMGTASYMSPEQARGRTIDKRTDVFAFGCVLYEALSGKRAFGGETLTDTLAAVVKSEPDWTALPADVPPRVRELLARCLRKQTERRWRDITDARIELEEALAEPSPSALPTATSGLTRKHLGLTALGGLLLGGLVVKGLSSPPIGDPDVSVVRASLNLTEGAQFNIDNSSGIAIAPDGTHVAYSARIEGRNRIFIQSLESMEPRQVETDGGAAMPFFSPDSQSLGFETGNELKKVALSGGAPVTITTSEAAPGSRGATWAPDDTIVFARYGSGGLSRVSANGGAVDVLTEAKLDDGEKGHRFPHMLPGGKALLFTIARSDIKTFDDAAVAVLSMDTGEYHIVVEGGSRAIYVDSGHVLYARASSLLAVPFDLQTLSVEGAPVPVVTGVMTRPLFGAAAFDVSLNGTLVYVSGEAFLRKNQLLWLDRNGESEPIAHEARPFASVSSAPTTRQLAVQIHGATDDIWIFDLDRDTLSPLVTGFDNTYPIWTPDGTKLAFASNRTGQYSIYWIPADRTGPMELLTQGEHARAPSSFTPDGQALFFVETHPDTRNDIWTLSMSGEGQAAPLIQTKADEMDARISPDGRWLAYMSDESGQNEVYVQPFPGPGRRWQVSTASGRNPVWNPAGGELFFRSRRRTMVVSVTGADELAFGKPRVLFETSQTLDFQPYGISPDGQRFAMVFQEPQPEVDELRLVFNWTEELKRLAPRP